MRSDKTFLSKVEFLLGGRSIYPWAESCGIGRGSVGGSILKGQTPKADTLLSISRSENVSLSWLMEDKGAPFIVNRCASDEEAADLLSELLAEPWNVLMAGDQSSWAIVLHMPCSHQQPGKESVEYTCVEIISGALGKQTLDHFVSLEGHRILVLEKDDLTRLATGHMGNYELFGWRDELGLISGKDTVYDAGGEPRLVERLAGNEPKPTYIPRKVAQEDAQYLALTKDEKALLKAYRQTPEELRPYALTAVAAIADRAVEEADQKKV